MNHPRILVSSWAVHRTRLSERSESKEKRCNMSYRLIHIGLILAVLVPWQSSRAIELGREAHPGASAPCRQAAFRLVSEALESFGPGSLEDLVNSCRAIIAARDDGCQIGGQRCPDIRLFDSLDEERRDLALCGAAVRRMGESGDRDWLPVLYELCPRFGRLVPREIQMSDRPVGLPFECFDAIIALEFGEMTALEFLQEWREHVVWLMDGGSRTHGDWRRMNIGLAFDRLTQFPGNQTPEVFDACMSFIADPDPRVRRLAAARFIQESRNVVMAISAALRFIAREDIDEETREVAVEAMRKRGYEPMSTPEGLVALPTGEVPISSGLRASMHLAERATDEERRERHIEAIRKQGYEPVPGPAGFVAVPIGEHGPVVETQPGTE